MRPVLTRRANVKPFSLKTEAVVLNGAINQCGPWTEECLVWREGGWLGVQFFSQSQPGKSPWPEVAMESRGSQAFAVSPLLLIPE